MTLIVEKHPEFDRLSRFFKRMESMAEHLGVPVDDLLKHPYKSNMMDKTTAVEQQEMAEKRRKVYTSQLTVVK